MTFAIDCVAGAGGFSLGAERAGLQVVAAINHWRCAVDTHAANLPHAVHRLEDACLLDWRDLPTFSVLLASPACQGHSRSRGQDRPHHDVSRSSAWAVIRAAEVCRPRAILVENVPEFTSWLLYDLWCAALQKLGYTLTSTLIDAADLGVPQTRVRLLLAATLGPPPHLALNPADRRPPQPADDTIAWEDGTWGPPARLVPRTQARIAACQRRGWPRALVRYNGSARSGRPASAPWGTLTTIDRWGLLREDGQFRMPTLLEYRRAQGFPDSYQLAGTRRDGVKLLGNAVPPALATWGCTRLLEVL